MVALSGLPGSWWATVGIWRSQPHQSCRWSCGTWPQHQRGRHAWCNGKPRRPWSAMHAAAARLKRGTQLLPAADHAVTCGCTSQQAAAAAQSTKHHTSQVGPAAPSAAAAGRPPHPHAVLHHQRGCCAAGLHAHGLWVGQGAGRGVVCGAMQAQGGHLCGAGDKGAAHRRPERLGAGHGALEGDAAAAGRHRALEGGHCVLLSRRWTRWVALGGGGRVQKRRAGREAGKHAACPAMLCSPHAASLAGALDACPAAPRHCPPQLGSRQPLPWPASPPDPLVCAAASPWGSAAPLKGSY